MLDKLFATILLSFASAYNVDVREPNRAIYRDAYTVTNATDYRLTVESGWADDSWDIDPHTTRNITFNTVDPVYVYSPINPGNNIGYCYFAPDSEDYIPLTFTNNGYGYTATIEAYEPAYGIGFYSPKALPTDQDLYYDTVEFDISNPTNTLKDQQVLPSGSTARLYKEDGSFTTVTSDNLRLLRYPVKGSSLMATALAIYTGTQGDTKLYIIVAMNYLVGNGINGFLIRETGNSPVNQLVENAEKSINTLSASLFYYSGYTNKVRFASGTYPFVPNDIGYNADLEFLTEFNMGYMGYDSNGGQQEDTFTALMTGIDIMGIALTTAASFFSFVIFPGITVGVLILIPLLVSLMFFLIKLIKRG